MPGLLGKKLGMTTVFSERGKSIPCTVLEVGPCHVLQVRTKENDGYTALQLGFEERSQKNVNKPLAGQFEKFQSKPLRYIREFSDFDITKFNTGDSITAEIFSQGEKVTVTGTSKGQGFQGVMKRHGFGGVGGTTHGQSDRLRAPGSIGSSSYPSRVFRGMRMAGRHGNKRVSLKNLLVVRVLPEANVILVKGAVPGAKQSLIEIHKQK